MLLRFTFPDRVNDSLTCLPMNLLYERTPKDMLLFRLYVPPRVRPGASHVVNGLFVSVSTKEFLRESRISLPISSSSFDPFITFVISRPSKVYSPLTVRLLASL